GAFFDQPLSITIVVEPSITTTSIPDGTTGFPYPPTTLTGTGGTAPYTWSVIGSLPPGLTLNSSTGLISGTPTQAGNFAFSGHLADALGASAARAYSLNLAATPTVATAVLPDGTVGNAYSQTLQGSGGTPPYTWTVSSGSLPSGLSLNGSTGVISGMPLAPPGLSNFTVTLTDSRNATASRALSLNITASGSPLTVTTASLPNGTVGVAYSRTLTASGGSGSYLWTTAGALPPGLSLTPAGVISGSPAGTAGASNFTVTVTDSVNNTANRALSITIVAAPAIVTTSLPNGATATAYSQTLAASGGTAPYGWSISSGSLPPGLSLNAASGAITGTPSAAGTSNFTALLTDALGATASRALSILVVSGPSITTTSLPNGTRTFFYSQTVQGTGGARPYTWSITAGSLPAGLALNNSTGGISGTPTAAGGPTPFTVRLTDSAAATFDQPLSITIVVEPSITTTSIPDGTVGNSYSQSLQGTGGTPPYTWAVTSGSLPSGLRLTASTGGISGTPAAPAAQSNFTVTLTDALNATASRALSINVTATASALTVTTASLPAGIVGVAYSQTLTASGGSGSYLWAVTAGGLPSGLNLSSSGVISGSPTAAGTFDFSVQVTDSAGARATRSLSLTVIAPLAIQTTSLAAGTVG
ncbi:MAG: putative Ig domain-containing protein, partial [Candidatus Solibacter usitatus]|nr:putative Ig domain-containing protein [Candidatus Solibacter usitatus]